MHLNRMIITLKRRRHEVAQAIAAIEANKRKDNGSALGRDRCRTVLGDTRDSATQGMRSGARE